MAAAAAPIAIALAAVAGGSAIYGGYQAKQSAKREASAMEAEGQLLQEEANREAGSHARDVRRFAANQSLSFLANGVTLAGSPLLVLDDTYTQGQEEVNAIVKSGNAKRNLYNQRASITRNQGRAALISGIGQAAGIGAGTASGLSKK